MEKEEKQKSSPGNAGGGERVAAQGPSCSQQPPHLAAPEPGCAGDPGPSGLQVHPATAILCRERGAAGASWENSLWIAK
ncbi:succinate dehydrogenase assembly factor 2, mitochondrial [Platysternon megacephalum]|uniref:Succinate dehydrogenase assembly factor 2, mitochondrial n=1 Tax=Platysternon megacephalum TaxID=55544 RepID=A0A4D9E1Z8_9SAUR|nr:succinate dehydrogenase assembly factor 2, mitochondrial [Platysternon megacephalum]